jgi:geranylgeranyl diphosphate synthase type II
LILDDLPSMDDATLRRGRPALHKVVGEANAILAAVSLLNAAYAAALEAPGMSDRTRAEAAALLTRAVGSDGLIGGQVQDLAGTGQRLDLEALEWTHSHKTGALFLAAAELGALASGARTAPREAVLRYAKNLGLAFQITDDLLDYSGNPATTGKDAGQDRERTTFVNLCGIEGARRLVDELVDAALAALARFGKRAATLHALAELVRSRDR